MVFSVEVGQVDGRRMPHLAVTLSLIKRCYSFSYQKVVSGSLYARLSHHNYAVTLAHAAHIKVGHAWVSQSAQALTQKNSKSLSPCL